MAKARQAQNAQSATPPLKHTPAKVLPKKTRVAQQTDPKVPVEKKGSIAGSRIGPSKNKHAVSERRNPVELSYKGTMRSSRPAEPVYKGTAQPSNAPVSVHSAPVKAKSKRKPSDDRYAGYANWSDLDDVDDEEEDKYGSDCSSDMEGGLWDVEEEERRALAAARKEDAEALQEENDLKRQKLARKRKHMATTTGAARYR